MLHRLKIATEIIHKLLGEHAKPRMCLHEGKEEKLLKLPV